MVIVDDVGVDIDVVVFREDWEEEGEDVKRVLFFLRRSRRLRVFWFVFKGGAGVAEVEEVFMASSSLSMFWR